MAKYKNNVYAGNSHTINKLKDYIRAKIESLSDEELV